MRTQPSRLLAASVAALALVLPGAAMAGDDAAKQAGTGGAGALSDPEIAAIVLAANDVDIEAGKQARNKATDPQVKQFAQTMVTDHTALNEQTKQLAKKLNVEPKDNPTAKKLKDDGKATRDRLGKLEGDAYDRAYVDSEVTYHTAVLDTIDQQLIPNAQNPELKALLQKARPVIDQHLQHARQLQNSMRGIGGTGEQPMEQMHPMQPGEAK